MKKILLSIKSLVILLISFSFFFTLNNGIKLKADESIENKVTISSSTSEITQGNSATANVYIETLKDISSLAIEIYFNPEVVSINYAYNSVSNLMNDSSINEDNIKYTYIFNPSTEDNKTLLFYFNYKINNDALLGQSYFDIIISEAYDLSLNNIYVKGSRFSFNV